MSMISLMSMNSPKSRKSIPGANQESSLRPMANGDPVSGRSDFDDNSSKVKKVEEIQITVRLRGDDLDAFKRVKDSMERPNNLKLDNAEVLRSSLRDKAKALEETA
jgi:hypothetical protein